MKVGIVEYFNGSAPYLDAELLLEGYAMLKSTIDDFLAAGLSVMTILDRRLDPCCRLGSAEVIWSSESNEFERKLTQLSQSVDYTLLIAPEYYLPTLLERLGSAESLNSTPESIRAVSDKCRLGMRLATAGLGVPEFACFDEGVKAAELKSFCMDIGYPVAVKPAAAAGCEGLSLVKHDGDLEAAYRKASRSDPNGKVMVQKWYEGMAASVSMIVFDDTILPLSLNRQLVSVCSPNQNSTYLGGVVPLPHRLAKEAFAVASKAVGAFRGLRGYVGLDLILTGTRPLVLEVNPRITVSYIGISRVLDGGVARLMIDEEHIRADSPLRFKGYASFIKATLPRLTKVDVNQAICSPLRSEKKRCFLLAEGDSYEVSLRILRHIISLLSAEVGVEVADLSA